MNRQAVMWQALTMSLLIYLNLGLTYSKISIVKQKHDYNMNFGAASDKNFNLEIRLDQG